MPFSPVSLLVFEGDPVRAEAAREALAMSSPRAVIRAFTDFYDALTLLKDRAFAPDLALIDADHAGGMELLKVLKQDGTRHSLPVVVFTSASEAAKIAQAYDCQANCVILKPEDIAEYRAVVKQTAAFWLECALIPRHRQHSQRIAASTGSNG